MKTVNKKEFPLVDKLINSLLKKFKKQGWQFPEIYFSDEIIQLPINKNGLQGFYPNLKMIHPNNNEAALLSDYKYETETPIIIIYEKVLEKTAKKFEEDEVYKRDILHLKQEGIENDYCISFEEARINLFYCAVLNEISKWILVDTPKKNTWKNNPLNKKDHLHECLTALLSYWICEDGSLELKISFKYLMFLHTKGQENIGEYNRYSDYTPTSFEIPSIINCITICKVKSFENIELFTLLLDISKLDKTLNRNNFKPTIVKNEVQKIIIKEYRNQIERKNVDINLTDILYGLIDDKSPFVGSQAGRKYGL